MTITCLLAVWRDPRKDAPTKEKIEKAITLSKAKPAPTSWHLQTRFSAKINWLRSMRCQTSTMVAAAGDAVPSHEWCAGQNFHRMACVLAGAPRGAEAKDAIVPVSRSRLLRQAVNGQNAIGQAGLPQHLFSPFPGAVLAKALRAVILSFETYPVAAVSAFGSDVRSCAPCIRYRMSSGLRPLASTMTEGRASSWLLP